MYTSVESILIQSKIGCIKAAILIKVINYNYTDS